jgi:hypothetical protein
MTARVSRERLHELFSYDPETGDFVRIKGGRGLPPVGTVFGCVNGGGYLVGMVDYRIYLLHQLAYFYMTGEWADYLDHADGDKTNNKFANLRKATASQNNANVPRNSLNTSGYKGVSWTRHANKYRASIKVNNRTIHLGYRAKAEEAHELYCAAAEKHFGEFARTA